MVMDVSKTFCINVFMMGMFIGPVTWPMGHETCAFHVKIPFLLSIMYKCIYDRDVQGTCAMAYGTWAMGHVPCTFHVKLWDIVNYV